MSTRIRYISLSDKEKHSIHNNVILGLNKPKKFDFPLLIAMDCILRTGLESNKVRMIRLFMKRSFIIISGHPDSGRYKKAIEWAHDVCKGSTNDSRVKQMQEFF